MAFDGKSLDGYVDVAERIAQFRDAHPAGYLAPLDPAQPYRIEAIGERTFIVVIAGAYREPGDTCPGVGMAWEPFPGRTPYTRDSELMNAETSAWGRAIIAVGAADAKRGVRSREEVQNREADHWEPGGQVSEADKWRPDPNPSGHKADRHHATREPLPAENTPWTSEPAAEDTPGTSTPDQHRDIAIRLDAKGITDRDAKLKFCSEVTKRRITSSKGLSYLEAAEVLRHADKLPAAASG